jgi:uracil DNA glycosylase
MTDQPLNAQGPFKAEVKWKAEVTDEQRELIATMVADLLKAIDEDEAVYPFIPDIYKAIESITLSPSGN